MGHKNKGHQAKNNPNAALLNNNAYAVKGSKTKRPTKAQSARINSAVTKQSKIAMEKGQKMAKIEAYAKEHGVTITQAMIHFME